MMALDGIRSVFHPALTNRLLGREPIDGLEIVPRQWIVQWSADDLKGKHTYVIHESGGLLSKLIGSSNNPYRAFDRPFDGLVRRLDHREGCPDHRTGGERHGDDKQQQ